MSVLLPALLLRAKLLALLTLIAFFAGEKLAGFSQVNRLAAAAHTFTGTLGQKLNRPSRSIGIRVYRGIIALAILEIPALAAAVLLTRPDLFWLEALVVIALLGRGFASHTLLAWLKQARAGTLALQADNILFADTHGVLRHMIATSAERFAVRVIGGGFWFVVGGLPMMLAYLALAMAAAHYAPTRQENLAFGWAATRLYRFADALPRLLATLLLLTGGLCVPRTSPFRALRKALTGRRNWLAILAELLDISLGGRTASEAGEVELPWQGSGTAQLTAQHLASWCALLSVASLTWLIALLSITIV